MTTAPPFQSEDWVTGVSYLSTWRAAESGAITVTMPIWRRLPRIFSSLLLDLVEQAGREDILVYADGLPWMLKNDRQESLVLMELLLLLFRDGLILETGLYQPLYNEDLRQRLAMCFAGWTEGMLRKGLELEEKMPPGHRFVRNPPDGGGGAGPGNPSNAVKKEINHWLPS